MSAPGDTRGISIGSIESWDLDEYAEQVGPWDVRLDKVSAGKFHSAMRFLKVPGVTLYDEHWEHRVVVRGSPPEGLVMLGTNLAPGQSDVRWCGQLLDTHLFGCAEGPGDIDFVMPNRAHDAVVLIDPELFERAVGSDAREKVNRSSHVDFDAATGLALARTMVELLDHYHRQPALLQLEGEAARFRSRLLGMLADCFAGESTDSHLSPSQRGEMLQRALEHIESNITKTSAWETAEALGISRRTLEHLFRDSLGTTPGKYLGLLRLNRCHHDLYHADPSKESVTSVAMRWGFTHLGRFSGAYRKHFGELPSETLGKSRPHKRSARLTPL